VRLRRDTHQEQERRRRAWNWRARCVQRAYYAWWGASHYQRWAGQSGGTLEANAIPTKRSSPIPVSEPHHDNTAAVDTLREELHAVSCGVSKLRNDVSSSHQNFKELARQVFGIQVAFLQLRCGRCQFVGANAVVVGAGCS